MKLELVRWKRFKENFTQKEGWFSSSDFKHEYDEVITPGILMKEDESWLTLATSFCNNMYSNPLDIFKPTIINRRSFEVDIKEEVQAEKSKDFWETRAQQKHKFAQEEKENQEPRRVSDMEVYRKVNIKQLIENYEKLSQYELAQMFGVCRSTVMQVIHALIKEGTLQRHEKFWKSKEPRNTQKTVEMNPVTQKIQQRDWLTKYNLTEQEVREAINAFPTRKEAAEYLGIEPRALSFITNQIGARARQYSRRGSNIGFDAKKFLNKYGMNNFVRDYYALTNQDLFNKYDINVSTFNHVKKELKNHNVILKRKRVCKTTCKRTMKSLLEELDTYFEPKKIDIDYDKLKQLYNEKMPLAQMSKELKIPYDKMKIEIEKLTKSGELKFRKNYYGTLILYSDLDDYIKQRDALAEKNKEKINYINSTKEEKSIKTTDEGIEPVYTKQVVSNPISKGKQIIFKKEPWKKQMTAIEDDVYLYALPEMGGAMKFNPPINKEEFVKDMETMDISELSKKYNKAPLAIDLAVDYLKKSYKKPILKSVTNALKDGVKFVFDSFGINPEEFRSICERGFSNKQIIDYYKGSKLKQHNVGYLQKLIGLENSNLSDTWKFCIDINPQQFVQDCKKYKYDELARIYKTTVPVINQAMALFRQQGLIGKKGKLKYACR